MESWKVKIIKDIDIGFNKEDELIKKYGCIIEQMLYDGDLFEITPNILKVLR